MLTTVVPGTLAVVAIMVLSVVGLEVVQRTVPASRRQEHNDVAGFIYAVVGVVYAVMLALVVIAVWEQHEAAEDTVRREANELAEVYWLAHGFPEPEGRQLQQSAQTYAEVVIEDEWPLMDRGRFSPEAWELMDQMRLEIQNIEVDSRTDQVLLEQGLERMEELADARRSRLGEIDEGIPGVLWVVLISGGALTIGFTYLFGLSNSGSHRLMVAALAGMVALVLFTICALEYPYSGASTIEPDAFERLLDRFDDSQLDLLD